MDRQQFFDYQKITDTAIGITGFHGDTSYLVIPETIDGYTVTRIYNYAIDGWWEYDDVYEHDCDGIWEIAIPSTVIEIDPFAFGRCSILRKTTVDEQNPAYASVDGILYDKPLKTLLWCPEEKQNADQIPDTVSDIVEKAFCRCAIERIVLGEQITRIRKGTFCDCVKLQKIVISDTVTHVEDEAFSGCTALEELCLPAHLESIGARAFEGCSALRRITIPAGVAKLGEKAFAGCIALEEVSVPESMVSIGGQWLDGCQNLKKIEVAPGHPLLTSENGVLYNKDRTILYRYPCASWREQFQVPDTVAVIEEEAFLNSRNLKNVVLPRALLRIGKKAFYGCENLTGIRIPENVMEIGSYAFLHCKKMKNIVVDEKNVHFMCKEGVLFTVDMSERVAMPYGKLFYREDLSLEELELSMRAHNCLQRAGITTVGELLQKSDKELMQVRSFGKNCLENVERQLEVKLGMTIRREDSAGVLDESC